MRTIFFNIAWMKYYQGNKANDRPKNGGKYIADENDDAEVHNFKPKYTDNGMRCFGYGATIWRKTMQSHSQLHIENLDGCSLMKNADYVDDVLVVWCSTYEPKKYRVVGWYKNATLYRYHQNNKNGYYISCADVGDCVLLPENVRLQNEWAIPRAKEDGYGFGQANMWYPTKYPEAIDWLENLSASISNYTGDNWINL